MKPIEGLSDRLAARNKVLNNAADLIRRDGWCKFLLRDEEGRHCAWGAIITASGQACDRSTIRPSATYVAAMQAIRSHLGTFEVGEWNNNQSWFLGKYRVIRALRAATKQPLTV